MKETLALLGDRLRAAILVLLVVISVILGGLRLMKIQVVNGTAYLEKAQSTAVYAQPVSAARGEIVDSDGNTIVGNKIGYNIIVEKAYFPADNGAGNAVLLEVANLLKERELDWNDTMPITMVEPFSFLSDSEEQVAKLRTTLNLNTYATAQNCMDKLIGDYDIADTYSPREQRIIAGIRYEMLLRSFAVNNHYTFAEDIPAELVTLIKERRLQLPGFDVIEEAIRTVKQGDILPHEIGTVGPIYSKEEFEQLKENGLTKSFLRLEDGALRAIISDYTSEAGVRTLERTIGAVCRKGAIAKMDGKKSFRVNEKKVHELLGPVQAMHDKIEDKSLVGCVTGLAWTAVGGEILTIEATAMKGSGQLQLTGKLGDVMQESAKAAVSYIRAHATELGIDEDFHTKVDLHIHVPMGATPKDGPSAGVTMVTAIYSALSGKPVPQTIAMTGEISLRGRVLPIGGLKEKSIAANRAGAKIVLYPRENTADLVEVPESIRKELDFRPMDTLDDVLKNVFTSEN